MRIRLWSSLLAVLGVWGGAVQRAHAAPATLRCSPAFFPSTVAHDVELNPTGQLTLEAWVNPNTTAPYADLVNKGREHGGYALGLANGRVRFTNAGVGGAASGTAVVPVGSWTHVAVTFDGVTRRFFVNGILDHESTTPGPVGVTTEPLRLCGGEATGSGFTGSVAEVRLWSQARTQAQIRASMMRQVQALEPGLITAWSLEGGLSDVTGRHTAVGAQAGFTGTPAPPLPDQPMPILQLAASPTVDGRCLAAEYGTQRIPIFYPANEDPQLAWAYVGATASSVHVCLTGMTRNTGSAYVALHVDGQRDLGTIMRANDFRIRVFEGFPPYASYGSGVATWDGPALAAADFDAATDGSEEFTWQAEFRFSRSLITSATGMFGLALVHQQAPADNNVWPTTLGTFVDAPDGWALVQVDTTPVRSDASPPTVITSLFPEAAVPRAGIAVSLVARATDDVDLASITMHVDGVAARTCDLGGTNDTTGACSVTQMLDAGLHTVWARAQDHRGRTRSSAVQSFRVLVDGAAPALRVVANPERPMPGTPVLLTAVASDEAAVRLIEIVSSAFPYTHRCTFTTSNPTSACTMRLDAPPAGGWFSYSARAVDNEDFESRTAQRYLVSGAAGMDSDGDTLPDSLEDRLCTSPTNPDSDRDGLRDDWEIIGVQFPDGTRTDLPVQGANPCRRDVFLQYDFETGAHLDPGAVEFFVAGMRRSGVDVHVTENERPRVPRDLAGRMGAVEAAYQRTAGRYWFDPHLNATHYYAYSRLVPGRSGAWGRYFTFDALWNGVERNAAGDYVLDANGALVPGTCDCPVDVDGTLCRGDFPYATPCVREGADAQARRMMHELGHSMGFGHGGRTRGPRVVLDDYLYYDGDWDGYPNQKPNYMSVMNYLYNGGLQCMLPLGPDDLWPSFVNPLSYSELNLGDLNENALPEQPTSTTSMALRAASCADAAPGAIPVMLYSCADPDEGGTRYAMVTDGLTTLARVAAGAAWQLRGLPPHPPGVDWNCDGRIDPVVAGNINGDGADFLLPPEACDGTDNNSDGTVDEGCDWSGRDILRGHVDPPDLPSPPSCNVMYRDDGAGLQCYPHVAGYVALEPGPDCRPSGAPAVSCAGLPVLPGPPQRLDQERDQHRVRLPGVEGCNGLNDDGDDQVDEGCRDTDGDGTPDAVDTCPRTVDPTQADRDGDGVGDVCQAPSAVTGLVVTGANASGITLGWDTQVDVLGWNVYRGGGGPGLDVFVGDTFPTTTGNTFVDSVQVTPGQYSYVVRPVNLRGVEGPDRFVVFTVDAAFTVGGATVGSDQLDNPGEDETDPVQPMDPDGGVLDGGLDDAGVVPDAAAPVDAGMTPDAAMTADAGSTRDAGMTSPAPDAGSSGGGGGGSGGGDDGRGCSCGSGGDAAALPPLWLALLVAPWMTARRRRR